MKKMKDSRFIDIVDVFFIMILCFITLLTTMLMQGGVIVGGSAAGIRYDFSVAKFALVIGWMIAYLLFIIRHSNKELKSMIVHVYNRSKSDIK